MLAKAGNASRGQRAVRQQKGGKLFKGMGEDATKTKTAKKKSGYCGKKADFLANLETKWTTLSFEKKKWWPCFCSCQRRVVLVQLLFDFFCGCKGRT